MDVLIKDFEKKKIFMRVVKLTILAALLSCLVPLQGQYSVNRKSPNLPEWILASNRSIDELNSPISADAYPWISADANSLYYTQANEEGTTYLVHANRENTNEAFEYTHVLEELGADITAATFTPDERCVFFFKANTLYLATRPTTEESFGTPTPIVLVNGSKGGYYTAPSISADGSQLFLYYAAGTRGSIQMFSREKNNTYTFASQLEFPSEYSVRPGQISKDGLSYWVELVKDSNSHLYRGERRDANDDFHNWQVINTPLMIAQPSIADDGTLIYTSGKGCIAWSCNDLQLAHLDFQYIKSEKEKVELMAKQ